MIVLLVVFVQKVTVNDKTNIVNSNLNKTLDLHAMADVIESIDYDDKYAVLDSYVGNLTGYGADCALCSGKLGCTGQDVSDGTTTYHDKDYGKVRIVASSKNLKCGTIIKFESKRVSDQPVLAIVLDRGVGGTAIDLLTESEAFANKHMGRSQIKYDVLREGWEK